MNKLLLCSAGIVLAGTSYAQVPSNDDCASALAISAAGAYAFPAMATMATDSTIDGACAGRDPFLRDVFFVWTAPSDGQFEFRTENTVAQGELGYDTVMTVYEGTVCDGSACLFFNDDTMTGAWGSTVVTNNVTTGTVYTIQVGTWDGASGVTDTNSLHVTANGIIPPDNDDCSAPTIISGEGEFPIGDAPFATDSDPMIQPACATRDMHFQDLWFEWTAPLTDNYSFSTQNTVGQGEMGYDTMMAVYDNQLCDGSGCIGWNDDKAPSGAFGSEVITTTPLIAGNTYTIQVSSWSATSGETNTNTLTIEGLAPAPSNDTCASPEVIAGMGVFPVDNTFAGNSGLDAMGCTTSVTSNNDLWYAWTGATIGEVTISTLDSSDYGYDTKLAVYDNNLCDGSGCIAYNDDGGGLSLGSQVKFMPMPGITYYIQFATFSGSSTAGGPNVLAIDWDPATLITTFCDPSDPNSIGEATKMRASGGGLASGFYLTAFDGPEGEFGFMLVSTGFIDPGMASGGGNLCLGGGGAAVYRYNEPGLKNSVGVFDELGIFQSLVGTGGSAGIPSGTFGYNVPLDLPSTGGPITGGTSYHFQLWLRDGSGPMGSNFTNGVTAAF